MVNNKTFDKLSLDLIGACTVLWDLRRRLLLYQRPAPIPPFQFKADAEAFLQVGVKFGLSNDIFDGQAVGFERTEERERLFHKLLKGKEKLPVHLFAWSQSLSSSPGWPVSRRFR